MEIVFYRWECIDAIAAVFLVCLLLSVKLGCRCKGKGVLLIGFATILTINLSFLLLGGNSSILVYINIVLYLLFALYLCAGSRTKRILWGMGSSALLLIAEKISFALADALYYDDLTEIAKSEYTQFYLSAYFVLIAVILFAIVINTGKQAGKTEYELTLLQSIIVFLLTIVCAVMAELSDQGGIAAFSYTIIVGALYVLIFGYAGLRRQNDESKMKTEQLAFENDCLNKQEMAVKSLRELRHDISTHMHVMETLAVQGKNEELVAYFNDVNGKYKKDTNLFLTNNSLLNAMLTSKSELASRYDIEIRITYNTKKEIPLSYPDFCGLFGNLLDNAIEANQKVAEDEKRYIDLMVGDKGEMVFIRIINAADGRYLFREGELQTTKQDPKHGLGLKRIRSIAENAGGFLDLNPQIDRFIAFVMLPPIKE